MPRFDAPGFPTSQQQAPDNRDCFVKQALSAIDGLKSILEADLSPEFLTDLAAVARIRHWERCNLRQYLDQTLLRYEEALEILRNRVIDDPEAFFGGAPASDALHIRVAEATKDSYRFDPDLQAAVVCSQLDGDQLVNAVAELLLSVAESNLWRNESEKASDTSS